MLELTARLGFTDVAKRRWKDLALKEGLGLRDGLEEQSVPFVDVSPEDLQPRWLGATVGLEERGVINLAAADRFEIRHVPAAGLLLKREKHPLARRLWTGRPELRQRASLQQRRRCPRQL